MANPEIQFRRFSPDYSGMRLSTCTYGTFPDLLGRKTECRFDLMLPEKEAAGPLPVVIFIHGGGFVPPCDRRQAYISRIARPITRAGFAVISPDYPVFADEEERDRYSIKACAAPAAAAIHGLRQWLCANGGALGLDISRVSIMGGSAGGMTAFFAIAGYEDEYRAFINLWGAPDELPALDRFPPTISVHGTADAAVPYENEIPLTREFTARGIQNRLITLEGDGHTPIHRLDVYLPAVIELLKETNHV